MFRIAHISDLHIPPLPLARIGPTEFANKRLLGLFSWHHKWKREHRENILDALLTCLHELAPDHVCVTGDLTFTAHPLEIDQAARWLERLGDPGRVSLVPGNHDAYVPRALDYALDCWSPWMRDDDGRSGFPYVHRRGPVNIVGLSSAVATPPAVSLGRIGSAQLAATRALLEAIKGEQRINLMMVHHPPQDNATHRFKALADRKALQQVLAGSPVDLILHGHLHYPVLASLDSTRGTNPANIPVLGAASASTIGDRKSAAHFHLIEVSSDTGEARLSVRHYHYDADLNRFTPGEQTPLTISKAMSKTEANGFFEAHGYVDSAQGRLP